MKLKGEVALVTGGSRGIGRAICLALAEEGADVLVNYCYRSDKAASVCEEIRKAGGTSLGVKFDLSNVDETQSAIENLLNGKKKISILVNNAGISRDGLLIRYSIEDWNQVLETNLRGAFVASQAVTRSMMKERKGSIIHISSIVGLTGNPGQAAYCAAKAGIIGLTKSMAKELCSRNIRVNAVAPGYIATDMTESLTQEQRQAMLKHIPLGRPGTPEEVAHAVVFLASPESNYITGQVLIVAGGMGM